MNDAHARVPVDVTAALVTGSAPRDDRLWDGWMEKRINLRAPKDVESQLNALARLQVVRRFGFDHKVSVGIRNKLDNVLITVKVARGEKLFKVKAAVFLSKVDRGYVGMCELVDMFKPFMYQEIRILTRPAPGPVGAGLGLGW